jgi:hypothetical protein
MKSAVSIWTYLLWLAAVSAAQPIEVASSTPPTRWSLGEGMTTVWPVATDARLPHGDFIEQGGLRCGQVVTFRVDDQRRLSMKRGVVWPGLRYLGTYTRRRLLGEHVPYPVEVGPEGGQQHLSSESALYCRIFTEGLFGILPTGLDRFRCTPRLPDGWPRMALRSIRAFDRTWDLVVERKDSRIRVTVEQAGKRVFDRTVAAESTVEIVLP